MKRFFLGAALLLATAGCGLASTKQNDAMAKARANAENADIYIPRNSIELNNYNRRQQIADDPTTILWCTMFPFGDTGPVTFPVVGKLTSGNKRPYPTEQVRVDSYSSYNPELPGPDGMFGSSGEFRFGFDPAGIYQDVYNVSTYCTTQPMVFRRQASGMNVAIVDRSLLQASQQARAALQKGLQGGVVSQDALAEADRILSEALNSPAP